VTKDIVDAGASLRGWGSGSRRVDRTWRMRPLHPVPSDRTAQRALWYL